MLVPCLSDFGALRERAHRGAALVGLRPLVALAPDRQGEALGERVDHRDADAVEAAGDLVAAALAELAAGVEDREDDLGGGPALLLHGPDGDAAAVVGHGDAVVGVDDDLDGVGLAGQRLVHRVVDHLVDQVVEAARARRPDVHTGPLAYRLQSLEDRDVLRAVVRVDLLARSLVLRRLLRQAVPSVCRLREKAPAPRHSRTRAGALHKTALNISRLPPSPDAHECYKIPANRIKKRLLQPGFEANAARDRSVIVRQRTDAEAKSLHRARPGGLQRLVQTGQQIALKKVELVRPERRLAGDRDHPLALRRGGRGRRERPRRPPPARAPGPARAASAAARRRGRPGGRRRATAAPGASCRQRPARPVDAPALHLRRPCSRRPAHASARWRSPAPGRRSAAAPPAARGDRRRAPTSRRRAASAAPGRGARRAARARRTAAPGAPTRCWPWDP